MKLLLQLIISIIFIIKLSTANNYINLIPYKDKNCTSGNEDGIGFSSILNSCVSFDNEVTNIFIFNEIGNNISFTQYINPLLTCGGDGHYSYMNLINGQCINSAYFQTIDLNRTIATKVSYMKVQISNEPIILPGSYVMSYGESCNYGSGSGNVETDKIITVEYVTKGTHVKTHRDSCNDDVFIYSCDRNGQPVITSVNNICPKLNSHGETCIEFLPFKNETTASSENSVSGTSSCLDSGSGANGNPVGCMDSGSGSGPSYSSAASKLPIKLNNNSPYSGTGISGSIASSGYTTGLIGSSNGNGYGSKSPYSGTSTGISGSIASSGYTDSTGSSNSNSNNNGYGSSGNSDNNNAPLIYISTYCSN